MTKHREFWLTNVDDEYDASIYRDNPNFDWAIHVIEKSAYDELKNKYDKLEKDIDLAGDICADMISEKFGKLTAALKIAKDALVEVSEYLEPRLSDKFGSRGREFVLPSLREHLKQIDEAMK